MNRAIFGLVGTIEHPEPDIRAIPHPDLAHEPHPTVVPSGLRRRQGLERHVRTSPARRDAGTRSTRERIA